MALSVQEILNDWELSEDDIEAAIGSFMDGWWSSQTRTAIKNLRASALDLNEGWAATPTWWSCPICKRRKADIIRINQKGVAIAHLVNHHDHIDEYIEEWKRAQRASGAADMVAASGYFRRSIHDLSVRFSAILVCEDCNNSDGRAKSWIEGDIGFFSFSPEEISGFISPAPNAPHELKRDAVYAAFQSALPLHQARMTALNYLLAVAASGSGWITLTDGRLSNSCGGFEWRRRHEASLLRQFSGITHGEAYRLLRFSCRKEGTGLGSKPKAQEVVRIPTESDYRSYAPQSFLWDKCGDSWRCAVCQRSKFEVLRWNPKKCKWSGNIVGGTAIAGQSAQSGASEAERMARTVCEECNNVNAKISWAWRLNADEIRAIATFTPHRSHQIDLSLLEQFVGGENWIEEAG